MDTCRLLNCDSAVEVVVLRRSAVNAARTCRLVAVDALVGDAKKDAAVVTVGRRDRASGARVKGDVLPIDREWRSKSAFDSSDDSGAVPGPAVRRYGVAPTPLAVTSRLDMEFFSE